MTSPQFAIGAAAFVIVLLAAVLLWHNADPDYIVEVNGRISDCEQIEDPFGEDRKLCQIDFLDLVIELNCDGTAATVGSGPHYDIGRWNRPGATNPPVCPCVEAIWYSTDDGASYHTNCEGDTTFSTPWTWEAAP